MGRRKQPVKREGRADGWRTDWPEVVKEEVVEAVFWAMTEGKVLKQVVEEIVKGWPDRVLESDRELPEELPGVLSSGLIRTWITRNEAWWYRYQQAKAMLGQALAEEAVTVARDSTNFSSNVDRVLIETLKWASSKANPTEYGDRQMVEHQGNQTLQVKIVEEEGIPRHGTGRTDERIPVIAEAEAAVLQHMKDQQGIPLLSAKNPIQS